MSQYPNLFHVFIILAAASVMVPLASRFKLGSVIGYLIVGILIGPNGFQFIENVDKVMHFAEFGVIMMLFIIGLELEPQKLWKLRKLIVGLGSLQVTITTTVLTIIGIYLGYAWQTSLAISMALTLSSTALVLQMLEEKNLMKTMEGETSFAVLLLQDIAVIPILIIMPLLNPENYRLIMNATAMHVDHLNQLIRLVTITGSIGAIILVGRYLSGHLFFVIAKTNLREVFTAFSLALVVGITLLMQSLGVSPALGAFIAGVVLANSQYKHTVEGDIQPFKGLFLGLFFISVGMSINFSLFAQHAWMIVSIVAGLIAIKALILSVLGYHFDLTKAQTLGFALALSQGGEFAFVLFEYASNYQVISADLKELFTLVVTVSMFSTPLLMLLYHHFVIPRFMSKLPMKQYDPIHEKSDIILAGFGRFGQIIGRLLSAEGIKYTVLEKNPEQIELLRKFGYPSYFGDASRLDILKSAGAAQAKLLIVSVGNQEKNLQIVHLAKLHFPSLTIYARARNRRHAYELHKAGVNSFRRELFNSSLEMTKDVLKFLGYKTSEIEHKANAFAKHDEEFLYQSFEFFDEEKTLIHHSKQAKSELERILQNSTTPPEQDKNLQSSHEGASTRL